MLSAIELRILRRISPREPACCSGSRYNSQSKLSVLLGDDFLRRAAGKTIIDFGCGEGVEAIELARHGARRVIGIDIREEVLQAARQKVRQAAVEDICQFTTRTNEVADIIVSIDGFEHYSDPAGMLRNMHTLLKPDGEVLVSFGPVWYHPLGGHLFSVFPWAHILFSEEALMRWRAGFKADGATRFSEVAGGLNQMTIKKFERLIRESPFRLVVLELVPIQGLRHFQNRLTREFTTASVRCRLVTRAPTGA